MASLQSPTHNLAPFDVYNNTQSIVIPDVMGAVYDYVAQFSDIDKEAIFLAGTNRMSLPRKSNSFAILSLVSTTRYGTNTKALVYDKEADKDILTTAVLKKMVVQIDVYGNSLSAALKSMEQLHILWRDPIACSFFEPLQINPMYEGEMRNFTETDASDQFTERFSADFTLCAWQSVNMEVQTFSHINVKECINIDVMSKTLGI